MPCLINDPIWGFSGPYFLTFEPEKLGLQTISTQWQIHHKCCPGTFSWKSFKQLFHGTLMNNFL